MNLDKEIFKKDGGTVLVMIAFLLPLFFMLIGMVSDIGNALACRAELNKACMAAAEEVSKQIDMEAAQQNGLNQLASNYGETIYFYFNCNRTPKSSIVIEELNWEVIGGDKNPKYINVYCSAKVECFFLKLIGINDIAIHSNALGRLKSFKL